MDTKVKRQNRIRRHQRVRAKIFGTKERPRLSVFRSSKNVFLQLIDDELGKTIISSSSREVKELKGKGLRAQAAAKLLAERAVKSGIKEIVFDRGGYKFHGLVKAVADATIAEGIKI